MGPRLHARTAPTGRGSADALLGAVTAGQMRFERLDDRVDDILMRAGAAFHMNVRFLVGLPPLGGELLEDGLAVTVAELRPGVPARSPFGEDIDGRVQPDRDGSLVQQLSSPRINISSA